VRIILKCIRFEGLTGISRPIKIMSLGYNVSFGKQITTFQRTQIATSPTLKMEATGPSETFVTKLLGIASQKTVIVTLRRIMKK
jgi:hypothetical protein